MKLKFISLLFISVIINLTVLGQVGIGTTNPHPSAILDIESSIKGFLPPRMTTLEKHQIVNPTKGLMVYCKNCCESGALSFFNGNKWVNKPNCTDTDFDDDGIPNNIDIDDDNDGILDVLESLEFLENLESPNINFEHDGGFNPISGVLNGFKYSSANITDVTSISYSNIRKIHTDANGIINVRLFTGVQNGGNLGDLTIDIKPSETSINNSYITNNQLVMEDIDGNPFEVIVDVKTIDNKLINDVSDISFSSTIETGITNITAINLSSNKFKFTITQSGGTGDGPTFKFNIPGTLINQYKIKFTKTDGFSGDQIRLPITRSIYQYIDTDGDLIPNQFDINSDDDNCTDSYEAGFTTSTDINFNYDNTNVGLNGLSNLLENNDTENAKTNLIPNTVDPYIHNCN